MRRCTEPSAKGATAWSPAFEMLLFWLPVCHRPIGESLKVRAARPRSHDRHLSGYLTAAPAQDERQDGATTGGSDISGGTPFYKTSASAQKFAKMLQCCVSIRQDDHWNHQAHGEGCPAWPAIKEPRLLDCTLTATRRCGPHARTSITLRAFSCACPNTMQSCRWKIWRKACSDVPSCLDRPGGFTRR